MADAQRLLVSAEDFRLHPPIANNSNPDDVMQYVAEAQRFDLSNLLGKEFLADIIANLSLPKYNALMVPLKPVLCYYAYARYIQFRNAQDTASGFVVKKNEFSEPVSEKTLSRLQVNSTNLANSYAEDLIDFINENITDYPLYKNSCGGVNKTRRVKITPVSLK